MIYFVGFLMDFSLTTALLSFIYRAVDLNSSPMELGILGSAYSASYSILCFLLAKRLASINERIVLRITPIIIAITVILAWWARSVWMLIVLAGSAGIVASYFWPPLEHRLGRMAPPGRLYSVLGKFNIWWCSGMALGTALCGILYRWSFGLPLAVSCFCILSSAGVVHIFLRRGHEGRPTASVTPDSPGEDDVTVPQGPFLRCARIAVCLSYAAIGCIFALFPKLGKQLGMTEPAVSRVLFFLLFGQLTSFVILGKSRKWQYRVSPLLGTQVVCVAAFILLFAFESSAVLAAAFVAIGFSAGMSFFSSLFYTLHRPPSEAAFAGVHESLLSAGRVIGPLVAGLVASLTTLRYPYLLFCFVFGFFALYMILLFRKAWLR